MAALISWVCNVDHGESEQLDHQSSVTLREGQWAYCLHGGDRDHTWVAIEPTHVERLRVRHHISHRSTTEDARAGWANAERRTAS